MVWVLSWIRIIADPFQFFVFPPIAFVSFVLALILTKNFIVLVASVAFLFILFKCKIRFKR